MDIVEKLRAASPVFHELGQAADEIERLRSALQAYVDHSEEESERLPCCEAILQRAREALRPASPPPSTSE